MKPDPIRELVRRLLEVAQAEGKLTEAAALNVENEFRHQYSGESIYVPRRAKRDQAELEQMCKRYLSNDPPEQIAESKGISRRHLYRLLRNR